MLKPEHLKAAGADLNRLVIRGMENSGEFQKVVINRGQELDVERLRKGVLEAAEGFLEKHIGAVILECTNLVTFRTDVQHLLKAPVFDMVSLIEFFADGFRLKSFTSSYIP
jgi:hypothetical protein